MDHQEKIIRVAAFNALGDFSSLISRKNLCPRGKDTFAKEIAVILRGYARIDPAARQRVLTTARAARY